MGKHGLSCFYTDTPTAGRTGASGRCMPILTLGTRSILFRVVVGMRRTVSRYMVCVVQSKEQATARCMPPSVAQRKTQTGGRTASKSVSSMLYVSTNVNI
jgi:hypothetical protein